MFAASNHAMKPAHRAWVAAFALIGLVGVAPVSLAQVTGNQACPHFGPLPICHLVTIAYASMLVNVLRASFWHPAVFVLAWLPVFGLAATGSGLEISGHDICPKTEGGWPKCFFSLALACAVIVPVFVHFKSSD